MITNADGYTLATCSKIGNHFIGQLFENPILAKKVLGLFVI